MRLLQRLIFDRYCGFSNLDAYAAGVASMVQRSFLGAYSQWWVVVLSGIEK